jgi:membrane protease YdiL (CAAX protease family)
MLYVVIGSISSWRHWRSGGTVVPIIAHAFDNKILRTLPVFFSAILP